MHWKQFFSITCKFQIEKKVSKKNKHMEKDTAFSSMVDKYKSKILTQSIAKKKWYDEWMQDLTNKQNLFNCHRLHPTTKQQKNNFNFIITY